MAGRGGGGVGLTPAELATTPEKNLRGSEEKYVGLCGVSV